MSLALPLPGLTPLRRVNCQPPPGALRALAAVAGAVGRAWSLDFRAAVAAGDAVSGQLSRCLCFGQRGGQARRWRVAVHWPGRRSRDGIVPASAASRLRSFPRPGPRTASEGPGPRTGGCRRLVRLTSGRHCGRVAAMARMRRASSASSGSMSTSSPIGASTRLATFWVTLPRFQAILRAREIMHRSPLPARSSRRRGTTRPAARA